MNEHDTPVVLLTGGTSGIGRAAARKLAARGMTVLITGRRQLKGEAAQAELREAHPEGRGRFYQVDFADLDAVAQLAATVKTDYDGVAVLINNAGTVEPTRILTGDGLEQIFTVNYVAPFLLTNRLVPALVADPPGRVLNTVTVARLDRAAAMADGDLSDVDAVATGDYDRIPASILDTAESFDPPLAYVTSKLALHLFSYELADRLEDTGVTVACYHPGLIGSTDIPRDLPRRHKLFYAVAGLLAHLLQVRGLETIDGAATAMVHHAVEAALTPGEAVYFEQRTRADPDPRVHDVALRGSLWEFTAEVTNRRQPVAVV